MTLTTVEKAAKLIGFDLSKVTGKHPHLGLFIDEGSEFRNWFNPYTNKADLVDVECALGIDVIWITNMSGDVIAAGAEKWAYGLLEVASSQPITNHPDKFTARAHSVMAVVEQIYDAKYGKDG